MSEGECVLRSNVEICVQSLGQRKILKVQYIIYDAIIGIVAE
jgi:hypothetical protein